MNIEVIDLFKFLFSENWQNEDSPEYGTIAYEIKNDYFFECKVSVTLADWIESEGYGCDRPNQKDSDGPNYDPNGQEIIRIYADSYVDANFKADFLSSFHNLDFFNKAEYSRIEIENWINKSIRNAINLFNQFTVADIESGAPEDLYLNLRFNTQIILAELNEEWKEDTYTISGFNVIPKPKRFL